MNSQANEVSVRKLFEDPLSVVMKKMDRNVSPCNEGVNKVAPIQKVIKASYQKINPRGICSMCRTAYQLN